MLPPLALDTTIPSRRRKRPTIDQAYTIVDNVIVLRYPLIYAKPPRYVGDDGGAA